MERRIQTTSLLLLATVAAGTALYWLRSVMIPFVLALFIAVGLSTLVEEAVRRLRLPRPATWALSVAVTLLAVAGLGLLVAASVGQLASNVGRYQDQIALLAERTLSALPFALPTGTSEAGLPSWSQIPVRSVGSVLAATTNALVQVLSQGLLVLIFAIYLLIGRASRTRPPHGVWGEIESRISVYLVAKVVISAATGLLVGAVLFVLGVDLAAVFGLLAFLLNFIPSLGSVVATLLPLPVVLVSPDLSPLGAVLAIVLPGAVQFGMGNFVEPRVLGGSLDLHPVTILAALILWGVLWGVVGMLLATPITAILKILCEKLDATRPLAELLAGRLPAAFATPGEAHS